MNQDKNIFCIISAIGNNYGIFSYEERLSQLKNTIDSVHIFAPGSDILLVEASEELLPEKDLEYLRNNVNVIICLNEDKYITFLKYNSKDPTPNKFEKKTVGEIQSCIAFLEFLKQQPKKYNRVFKLGGRLALNSNFKIDLHLQDDKLVVLNKEQWYDKFIFPMRLWSFGFNQVDTFLNLFYNIQKDTYDHVTETGELKLVEFSFTNFVEEFKIPYRILDKMGVSGRGGLNGSTINE